MERLRREFQQANLLLNDIPAWVLSIFTAGCIGMNLLANKSINTNTEWLALDCGILVSWMAFFSMDIIVKRYGAKASIIVSVVALILNLLFSLVFWVASCVSGMWGESYAVDDPTIVNTALDNTFSGTWYIVFGSAIAFMLSAIVNSTLNEAIGKVKKQNNFNTFVIRSYVSTFVGQFVDNLTFAFIVSVNFFGWTLTQCITCALFGAVAELIMEAIFSPIGYRITLKWDKENIGITYRLKYTTMEM